MTTIPKDEPTLSLWAQIWGTTFEKIHTLGTFLLGISLVLYLVCRPLSKTEALCTFTAFGLGCAFIGWATLCNSWVRWRTGTDQLILLKRRGKNAATYSAELQLFGRSLHWQGPIAHVDTGVFTLSPLTAESPRPQRSLPARSYELFRAVYWTFCSSLFFQASFGLGAFLYGAWLLSTLHQYMNSSA